MNAIKKLIRRVNVEISKDEDNKVVSFLTLNGTIPQYTLIANLALMYGRAGERTVIIDTDFKNNAFVETFGLKNKIGLSNYLEKKNNALDDVLFDIQGQDVSIISAGSLNLEDDQYLLGEPRFYDLIKKLSLKYDHVLINTAAVRRYDDISGIVNESNAVILTTVINLDRKIKVGKLIGKLKKDKVKILGYLNAER